MESGVKLVWRAHGLTRSNVPRTTTFLPAVAPLVGCLLLGTPTPHPPGLMKSRVWREFFASVFESKGLTGKVFQE